MNWQQTSGRLLAAMSTVFLLTACASAEPEPPATSTAAVGPSVAIATPTTPDSPGPPAAPESTDVERTPAPGFPSSPTNRPHSVATPSAGSPSHAPDAATQTVLRLPVTEDLGPNYFKLFAVSADMRSEEGRAGGVSAAVVAFGFSARAKLRDERIIRNGPLAAVARITEHPGTESAVRFAAAANLAASLVRPDSNSAASEPRLTAAPKGSPPTSHELASDLTGARTLKTGWLTALDGTRMATVIEIWTVARFRTVLTVVLVWGSRINDGWGEDLLVRLAQTGAEPGATHAA